MAETSHGSHTRRTLQCSWDRILVLIVILVIAALTGRSDPPPDPPSMEHVQ